MYRSRSHQLELPGQSGTEPTHEEANMKRTSLLSSAALALTLGLTPALAQDRNETKAKQAEQRDSTAPQQRARKAEDGQKTEDSKNRAAKQNAAQQPSQNAEETSSRKDKTGQAANPTESKERADTTKANDSDKSSTNEKAKSADMNKQSPQSKRADEKKDSSPSSNTATNKPNAAESSKSAEQNRSSPVNEQKSTKANESKREAASSGANPKAQVSASLAPQKKKELHSAVAKLDVKPVTNVNFSVSVGTVIPRTISLRPVPTTIVEIVPQYRGYDFFVVRDEVVIVEPRSHKIVDVIERSGPSRARSETTTTHRPKLSMQQREIVRTHASSRRTTTTGAAPRTRTEIEIGEIVPETVEIESFPEEVYREVPEIRTYRYIDRGGDIYLVDPSSRRVIEEVR